jgi:hypothetical protein
MSAGDSASVRTRASAYAWAMLVGGASIALAQRGPTQPIPAPRPLGPVVGRSAQTFAGVTKLLTIRGGVFIQDAPSRQLWMFDTSLANGRVVLDSTSGLGKESFYGSRGGQLYRFRGDSILFQGSVQAGPTFWTSSPEGLVVGPSGRVGRIVTMPTGVPCITRDVESSGFYTCQVNLAFTWLPNTDMGDSVMSKGRADSAMFVSVNFRTWDADTIPALRLTTMPRTQLGFTYKGTTRARSAIEWPVLAISDAWATFRDGTLAIARGADYHLDIVDVRGNVTKGPRAPFEWRRITDADRDRLIDSLRLADSVARRRADSIAATEPRRTAADGTVLPSMAQAMYGSQTHSPPDEWPSYWPPLKVTTTGTQNMAVLVDDDDRIWVDERQPPGGDTISVYGIFDRKGQFLERVKVPATQTIRGFGPGGVIYLTMVDGGRATVLKRRFK